MLAVCVRQNSIMRGLFRVCTYSLIITQNLKFIRWNVWKDFFKTQFQSRKFEFNRLFFSVWKLQTDKLLKTLFSNDISLHAKHHLKYFQENYFINKFFQKKSSNLKLKKYRLLICNWDSSELYFCSIHRNSNKEWGCMAKI